MGVFLGDGSFSRIRFNGLEDLLSEFVSRAPDNTVLIIDEFPNMFKFRPALLSAFKGPYRKRAFIVSRKGFGGDIISDLNDDGILHFDLEQIGPHILDSRFDPR